MPYTDIKDGMCVSYILGPDADGISGSNGCSWTLQTTAEAKLDREISNVRGSWFQTFLEAGVSSADRRGRSKTVQNGLAFVRIR